MSIRTHRSEDKAFKEYFRWDLLGQEEAKRITGAETKRVRKEAGSKNSIYDAPEGALVNGHRARNTAFYGDMQERIHVAMQGPLRIFVQRQ
jgi:hypothetical protein